MVLTCPIGCASLVWSNNEGIWYVGTSSVYFVVYVDAMSTFNNSCLACLNIPFSLCASNCFCGSTFFFTHWCCDGSCLTASSPVLAPPCVTILIFLPSSLYFVEIHWAFWLFWFLFSWIFLNSVRQCSMSWSDVWQYIHVTGGSGHSLTQCPGCWKLWHNTGPMPLPNPPLPHPPPL